MFKIVFNIDYNERKEFPKAIIMNNKELEVCEAICMLSDILYDEFMMDLQRKAKNRNKNACINHRRRHQKCPLECKFRLANILDIETRNKH